ncbi:MAG: hypothetical protein ABI293_09035 [Rhodanobacter sp.]
MPIALHHHEVLPTPVDKPRRVGTTQVAWQRSAGPPLPACFRMDVHSRQPESPQPPNDRISFCVVHRRSKTGPSAKMRRSTTDSHGYGSFLAAIDYAGFRTPMWQLTQDLPLS